MKPEEAITSEALNALVSANCEVRPPAPTLQSALLSLRSSQRQRCYYYYYY